jgi:GWxTD domain-containing protein
MVLEAKRMQALIILKYRKTHRLGIVILLILAAAAGYGQAVNSVNFNYLYNLGAEVDMQLQPVMNGDSITLYFVLKANNPSTAQYIIRWEKKDSYSQRQGGIILPHDTVSLNKGWVEGQFRFAKPPKPWVLMARVTNTTNSKSWYFVRQIEAHYPVNGFLEADGLKEWLPYRTAENRYVARGTRSGKPLHFSFYRDNFPTPSPPFVDKEFKEDRFLFPDSTFTIAPGGEVGPFSQDGLYLAQEDTLSSEGFSFFVKKAPYPRYNTLGDLKGPLLFVTTRVENEQIGTAGEDKAKFDKVILDITSDKERAKAFMRNYFKRVEYANRFFTSYKEGWKTDRGMIFLVFGAPDKVMLNDQQEVWAYSSAGVQFTFNKVGSVYAPDHYVLIRDKDYAESWYMTVDLWRKSRF